MRKMTSIALAAMIGIATPVALTDSAFAQQSQQGDMYCDGNHDCIAWPAIFAAGGVIFGVMIAIFTAHHHHQVSP